ncbi:hypothetical protein M2T59_30180, partial [Klebsiella pneumoniae]|nr:hypothetical protein [Klebsiella pneumoniae]
MMFINPDARKKNSYVILDLHNKYFFKKITAKHHGIHYLVLKKRITGIVVTKFLEIPRNFPESFRPIPSSDGNYPYHFRFRYRENISEFVS